MRIFCEEVRKAPPDGADPLAAALDDAELQVHRAGDEPVLGAGALALTDSLTLLYSHRHLHEAAAAEAERARLQSDSFVIVLVSRSTACRRSTSPAATRTATRCCAARRAR